MKCKDCKRFGVCAKSNNKEQSACLGFEAIKPIQQEQTDDSEDSLLTGIVAGVLIEEVAGDLFGNDSNDDSSGSGSDGGVSGEGGDFGGGGASDSW